MTIINTDSKVKKASLEIVVIRANGEREDLGVVSFYHRNPLVQLAWNFKQLYLLSKKAQRGKKK